MTLEIVKMPNAGLREKTKPVKKIDDNLQTLIDEMIETMREAQGVGLAAPQIGRNLRMAVIESLPKEDEEGNEIPDSRDLFVVINPEIVWHSNEIVSGIEGCLSIPGYLGEVDRSESIRVRALNREGKKVKLKLNGWTARIFQHEIDHLDGVLFIDKLTSPENLWTEEAYRKMQDSYEQDPSEGE